MASFQLPDAMKNWKVASRVEEKDGKEIYSVVRNNSDGTSETAKMTKITLKDSLYTDDNIGYVNEEAQFINSISQIEGVSNYISAFAADNPEEKELNLLIFTDDSEPLSKSDLSGMSEAEVIDFGLKMSEVLAKLEENNIFHGNIKPENIFVKKDGSVVLGGFTSFESDSDDPSYLSPEIHNGEKADFTTDIYSLGLIMYSMCSGGKLPYEEGSSSKEEAAEKRFQSATVNAPSGGSEKLKSIIVIACQPQNKNRWKNAGNLKNALSSVKSELSEKTAPVAAAVIAPAATDFDSNVFEESSFDEFDTTEPEKELPEPPAEKAQAAKKAQAPENKQGAAENSYVDVVIPKSGVDSAVAENDFNGSVNEDDTEIDNRIFDEYDAQKTKVFNINAAMPADEKDYGDYFDEDVTAESNYDYTVEEDLTPVTPPVDDNYDAFEDNAFDSDYENGGERKSRKGLVIGIILGVVALLAILGILGFLLFKNGFFGGIGSDDKTAATTAPATEAVTEQATTQAVTTVPPTTAAPTEDPDSVSVTSVIGFGYYYAKDVLEAQGLSVEVSEYRHDDYYDEGYVISQTPEGDEKAKKGSTVSLVVSLGAEVEEETTEAPVQETTAAQSSEPEAVFSSFKNNTSYLTQAEVDAMSDKELEIALNEIYARRGRIFNSKELSDYFSKQSWYKPTYTAEEFAEKVVFNDYEAKNITLLYNKLYG